MSSTFLIDLALSEIENASREQPLLEHLASAVEYCLADIVARVGPCFICNVEEIFTGPIAG
jgi:hypothetical protein